MMARNERNGLETDKWTDALENTKYIGQALAQSELGNRKVYLANKCKVHMTVAVLIWRRGQVEAR